MTLWYEALNQPLGLYIKTPNPTQLKTMLYNARAKAQDPALAHLQIRTAPNDIGGELWIINPPKEDTP